MPATHPYIKKLLDVISLEEKEEIKRYSLGHEHSLKSLKAEGLALHPINVTRKTFGYADYPEITFKLLFPADISQFRDGTAIECFCAGKEPVKGTLLNIDGKTGEFRLFAPDFPDWIEDDNVGIKLAPDQRTITIMKSVMNALENNKKLYQFFIDLHEGIIQYNGEAIDEIKIEFINRLLNESQQQAVTAILQNNNITIVHGPPGTGKTTTLVEAMEQMIRMNEKVLVSAPSNTAVDNISKALIRTGIKLLRVLL